MLKKQQSSYTNAWDILYLLFIVLVIYILFIKFIFLHFNYWILKDEKKSHKKKEWNILVMP
jgi:hypothetical protein